MTSDKPPWTLTIPSDLRLLPLARAFVEAACQAGDLDKAAADAVSLATHEAVRNVIRHAHEGHPEAQVHVQCHFSPDAVEVRVLDEGAPFDLTTVPQLDPGELRLGGRGVFLMRTLMDEVNCRPRAPRGNVLHLVKRRAAKTPARDSA